MTSPWRAASPPQIWPLAYSSPGTPCGGWSAAIRLCPWERSQRQQFILQLHARFASLSGLETNKLALNLEEDRLPKQIRTHRS